jgi:hypothetical protein
VKCFENHVSEVAFLEKPILKFLGNRLAEAYILEKTRATEIELVEIGISFAAIPKLPKSRSSFGPEELEYQFVIRREMKLQRDLAKRFPAQGKF